MNIKSQGYKNGIIAEETALNYLINQGLREVRKNYRTRFGEIDLIMKDGEIIVFIEVRYRSNTKFLEPVDSINKTKVKKIIRTSQHYIQKFEDEQNLYRFDIIALTGNLDLPDIDWIKNAFSA